ncbi:MAG: hypothetical protein R3C44_22850 [Chloroflexota bacterium]
MERDDIDIIDISTPTYLPRYGDCRGEENRKHIFLEKPFSLTLEQALAEMYEAVLRSRCDSLR